LTRYDWKERGEGQGERKSCCRAKDWEAAAPGGGAPMGEESSIRVKQENLKKSGVSKKEEEVRLLPIKPKE